MVLHATRRVIAAHALASTGGSFDTGCALPFDRLRTRLRMQTRPYEVMVRPARPGPGNAPPTG